MEVDVGLNQLRCGIVSLLIKKLQYEYQKNICTKGEREGMKKGQVFACFRKPIGSDVMI